MPIFSGNFYSIVILFIIVLVVIWLLLRQFRCWYWKINTKEELLRKILEELKLMNKGFMRQSEKDFEDDNILEDTGALETKDMSEDELIIYVFNNYKSIAVYGMSRRESAPSYKIPIYLRAKQYKIIPINPKANNIDDLKSYPSIISISDTIDILLIFKKSEEVLDIVKNAIARKELKGDIKMIWLQEGIINDEAKELAEANGIGFIQDKCMYKEYVRLVLRKEQ